MKSSGLMAVAVLIAVLGLAGAASAQCDAVLSDGIGPSGGTYQIGDSINYYVTLSCPDGSCELTVDRIEFYPPPGSDDACDDTPLFYIEPGDVLVPGAPPTIYTVAEWPDLAYTIQPGDAGTTLQANICTKYSWINSGVPLDDEDTASSINFVDCPEPCVEVTKTVDCDISKVGDTVTYEICIENCGTYFDLTSVEVYDDLLASAYGSPLSGFPTSLAPGEQFCAQFDYEIQPGDDTGADYPEAVVTNTAHVTSIDSCDGTTVAEDYSDEVTVYLVHPGVDVEKVCLTDYVLPGDLVEFGITIHNTGDIPLDVYTDEPGVGPLTLDAHTSTDQFVVTRECGSASRQGDPVYNEISVTATIPVEFCALPNEYTAYDSAECLCIGPCIDVTKEVDCDISKVGDSVMYTICVTNCSDPAAPLVNVGVMDDVLGDLTDGSNPYVAGNPFPTTLAEGEQVCRTITYEIQPGDDDGQDYPNAIHENTVTVTGEHEAGHSAGPVSATEQVYLIHPDLEVTKDCLTPVVPAGGIAQFEITVTNTGDCILNITSSEPIPQQNEPRTDGAIRYRSEITQPGIGGPDLRDSGGARRILINPGEIIQWTVSRPDPGGVDCIYNEVEVTWTLPPEYCEMPNTGSVSDDACCEVVPPCIEVTKEVDCDTSKAGDEVVYHICVENCGVTELSDITVVDDVIGDISHHFASTLAPGGQTCAYVPYTILGTDPDPLVNVVTATGSNSAGVSVSDTATETVDLIHPSIEVTKECLTPQVPAGGDAQFEVVISNTGDCGLVVTTTEPEIPGPFTMAAGEVYTAMVTRSDPGGVDCVPNDITVTWTLPPEYCEMDNTGTAYAEACCEIVQGGCMVIIDEDGLDNDFGTVEDAAAALGVEPDWLINDDRPTEIGNPVLRWNEVSPGDIVLLPTGQVDDEGWFALPEEDVLPWTIADYIDGVVPQDQLDKIPDVMPLRNHELIALIGQTCVAVVYDSDISMNYEPINANLQGARYGLFYFTVLGYEVPGHLDEAQSSTSLVSLWLRIEEPHDPPNAAYHVQVRDHEPDAIEINRATHQGGVLTIWGESDFAPGAHMTVSVDGPDAGSDLSVDPLVIEETMSYGGGRYEFVLGGVPGDLSGTRLIISTDAGGSYNSYVE